MTLVSSLWLYASTGLTKHNTQPRSPNWKSGDNLRRTAVNLDDLLFREPLANTLCPLELTENALEGQDAVVKLIRKVKKKPDSCNAAN